ncbi:MAG: heme biosynthesis protein HemY, partial [Rhizobiaceae bacterium]
ACKLAPGLTPAASIAARLLVRLNDGRKAGKILETAWRTNSHPDIADAYVNLNVGDNASQRLARARKLTAASPNDREGLFAIAKAALDAGEFQTARDTMEKILRESASERSCLLMADIEQAEYGDRGRVREWLSRAVSAAKDPAWIADGVISEDWMPCSPTTGRLDAFEWKAPMQQLGAAKETLDLSLLANEPLADVDTVVLEPESPKGGLKPGDTKASDDADITDAEVVDVEPAKTLPENDNVSNDDPVAPANTNDPSQPTDSPPPPEPQSPFNQADLDSDKDGIIDHRPDDPGIGEENPKKEGWLF